MRGTDEVNAVREGGREGERKEEREVKGRREGGRKGGREGEERGKERENGRERHTCCPSLYSILALTAVVCVLRMFFCASSNFHSYW